VQLNLKRNNMKKMQSGGTKKKMTYKSTNSSSPNLSVLATKNKSYKKTQVKQVGNKTIKNTTEVLPSFVGNYTDKKTTVVTNTPKKVTTKSYSKSYDATGSSIPGMGERTTKKFTKATKKK